MSRFWSPFVRDLEPYVPGEQPKMARLVKLNTNEHPLGPSARVIEAIRAAADDRLRLYPDPDATELKDAIATYYGVDTGQVFVGNGSDEVLAHIFFGLFKQDRPLLFPDITYSFYKVYCGLYDIDYRPVPLNDDLAIDPADYSAPNGGIIFPNPNAPTGRPLALDAIETILQGNPDSVVVVDEAYVDFGGDTAIALVNRYPNLLVTQTLSKSRALAGVRIGFAVGDAALIEGLERIKNSFNSYPLDRLAIAAGKAAFEDDDWFQRGRELVIEERETLRRALEDLGFEVLPSAANFLFCRHPGHAGADLAAGLREQGIIVRHFGKPERIRDHLRITVGRPDQNRTLLEALQQFL
ncbi:histidinol-phosphate transaminase [Alloalcanivorax profundimaris]|uniref:histidinol-phosphate transaminase n=1 Tax=Alloalcanivorax profundimaris TaxID=2735259 RepID=UPI001888FA34|nr:histidinol-phosphate transaminase [Alloalcanivorax profundimaris]MBF1800706.1 histidinol-phosphate transaminase [Alloalcanivorax profundimaris]MCQ6262478.1 histidinol-phosphate transaminase [Alcanivorax sp. MM125-6]